MLYGVLCCAVNLELSLERWAKSMVFIFPPSKLYLSFFYLFIYFFNLNISFANLRQTLKEIYAFMV